ncbi:MAG: neutral/alkaline ceramidase [Myxococcaceae bacterium]|nr:neutral/alkaline ceramidase [Myxococcaceae bacterium]
MRRACPRLTLVIALALAFLGGCWPWSSPKPPPPSPELTEPGGPGLGGACAGNQRFLIGSGIHDITGPAAEVGMMGYGSLTQQTEGLHLRLRSRAFVIHSSCNDKRVVFVSADLGQLFQAVKQQVVERLRARYGDLYSDANVLLSATHTHSGPGGYSHYALYDLTTLGFIPQNFEAIVAGIVQSVVRAHENLREGTLRMAAGELSGASRNRSREAYELNPAEERARYTQDTDNRMTLVRFTQEGGREIGLINWFAVHGTSMGNTNHLISSDNKGSASTLFEQARGTLYTRKDTFVAAFAQSNEGDVTPNILGGTDGGGADDFEDTSLSARKQYARAEELYAGATASLTGGVDYRHMHVKMDQVQVEPRFADGQARGTCPAAIGVSMLAGAEDGPAYGREGVSCATIRDLFGGFVCTFSRTECQGVKPIILEMGRMKPYPWSPEVLPLQIVTLGNLALVAVPFELTTMSGRRLRETVRERLAPAGVTEVVIAGLSNAYAGYVATREEYERQDYEGASTHFGPWTLAALQQEFARLAEALAANAPVPPGPVPRDLRDAVIGLQPGVVFDDKVLWATFGGVVRGQDARPGYTRGETVRVTFWGGHPKNNLRIHDTFLRVQRREGDRWKDVAYDWSWETKYHWKRVACVPTLACSHITVEWSIPESTPAGTYRLLHGGDWKSGWDGKVRRYIGGSREFTVQ